MLLLPMARRDRATPGQIETWLGTASAADGDPATPLQVLIRFVVRWVPIIIGAFVGTPFGILIVVVVELGTVIVTKDRRSLSGLLSERKP
jgi:uncharacterized RDD family membrane protein YckC